MRRFVVALLSATAMSAVSANAADLPIKTPMPQPPVVVYSWAGPYVGIEGGYAWGHSDVTDVTGYNAVSPAGDFSYSPNGGVGNLYAGYNFQFDWFVAGVEGEVGYFGLDGSAQYPPYVGVRTGADSIATTHAGWYGAITGRVGVAFQNFLFFAKGGYAITGIKNSYTDTDPDRPHAGVRNGYQRAQWLDGRRRRRLHDHAQLGRAARICLLRFRHRQPHRTRIEWRVLHLRSQPDRFGAQGRHRLQVLKFAFAGRAQSEKAPGTQQVLGAFCFGRASTQRVERFPQAPPHPPENPP